MNLVEDLMRYFASRNDDGTAMNVVLVNREDQVFLFFFRDSVKDLRPLHLKFTEFAGNADLDFTLKDACDCIIKSLEIHNAD